MSNENENKMYCTSIIVHYQEDSGWIAKAPFTNHQFMKDNNVSGEILNHYYINNLSDALDIIQTNLKQLNVIPHPHIGIALLYEGDGEDEKYPTPPNYREILLTESQKRGWGTYGHFIFTP